MLFCCVTRKAHAVTIIARQVRAAAAIPDTPARDLAAEKRAKVRVLMCVDVSAC